MQRTNQIVGLLFFIAVILLIASCAGEAPEIRQVFWQLNAARDPVAGDEYETLSVFVNVADADGIEDIDLLYILQDQEELLWELDADGWQRFERGEEVWIGSNDVRMAGEDSFPRNLYRIIVIDRSGERSRDEFYINTDKFTLGQVSFPEASIDNGTISIASGFSEVTLWFYDDGDNLVKLFSTDQLTLPLSSALNTREVQTAAAMYVNAFDDRGGYGLIYGPVSLR